MPWISECPPPEIFALLWENNLTQEERKELLFHIADCNKCAMEYTILTSLMEVKGFLEQGISEYKQKTEGRNLRR